MVPPAACTGGRGHYPYGRESSVSAYATVDDVEARTGDLIAEADRPRVEKMIEDASAFIDFEVRSAGKDPAALDLEMARLVCTDLVASWWQTQGVPAGATSHSQTVGDVSETISYGSSTVAAARSPWFLSSAQRRLLGLASYTLRTVQMVPDFY